MFQRILVVCTGNICRSAFAEADFRAQLMQFHPAIEVASAGTGALVGFPADETTREISIDDYGLSLDAHRAKQANVSMTRWADLILVMEEHHLSDINRIDPTARGKSFLLGHWTCGPVADPYRRPIDAHRLACSAIHAGVQSWASRLDA